MKVTLLPHGSILVQEAFKQQTALGALDGAQFMPALKGWVFDATPGNAASLAALCHTLPPEVKALLPVAESRVIKDEGSWITYDPSLYRTELCTPAHWDGSGHVDLAEWSTGNWFSHIKGSLTIAHHAGGHPCYPRDVKVNVDERNRPRSLPPWDHQREAVGTALDLFGRGLGAALLMEQRTGKARVSIEVFARLARMGLVRRVLVVSLSTPCGDYAEQVAEYLDGSVPTALLFGSAAKRRALLAGLGGSLQVAIINYESSWRLASEIRAWAPDMAIADEMHKIKSAPKRTKTAPEFMRSLAATVPYRLGMTGTATPKNPLDLVGEYAFVEPSVFPGGYYVSKSMYAIEEVLKGAGGRNKTYTGRDGRERPIKVVAGYRRLDEFQAKMHSVAFVRRMDECHTMPPEAHIIVPVTLGAKGAAAYKALTEDSVIEWEGGETSADNILVRKMRQQQITSGLVPRDDGTEEICGTEKLDALSDTVSGILEAGKKVVVYARFSHEIVGALEVFESLGTRAAEVSGRVPIGAKRDAQIDLFKKDDGVLGFVGQIQAGGTGIDLSVAAVEVFMSKTHAFVDYDQARSRIVSGGKAGRKLTYYHLVVRGTVDDEIEEARKMKCDLSLMLLRRGGNPYEQGARL